VIAYSHPYAVYAKAMAVNHRNTALISRVIFRGVQPTDIPRCHQIEAASYPEDEAASKAALQYRQHHGAPFFRCAFLVGDSSGGSPEVKTATTSAYSSISYKGQSMNPSATLNGTIIGFVCATRCKSFTAESLKTHDGTGKILAIHSVVVEERYRNSGVASAMLQDYVSAMERLNDRGALKVKTDKIVLMAKKNLLAFYVRNGFMAMGVSPIVHGKEQWFELERIFLSSKRSDAKTHRCFLIDSFADAEKQGSGNPAGVVVCDGPPGEQESGEIPSKNGDSDSDESLDKMDEAGNDVSNVQDRGVEWMATVAKEFHQSETAFIWPLPQDKTALNPQENTAKAPAYAIRYYTRSGVEVDLCGHATLAAAFCMLHPKKMEDSKQTHKISFFAKNADLHAELLVPPANAQPATSINSNASRIAMNFPWKNITPISHCEKDEREDVLKMISHAFSGANSGQAKLFGFCVDQSLSFFTKHTLHIGTTDGKEDLLIELTEEAFDSLLGLKVDYGAFLEWQGYSRGVIICCCASTAKSEPTEQPTSASDFRSRFFGAKLGIDEDSVTGSAHCSLGPYFGKKLGKTVVVGRQESERGGLVECILKPEEGRVCIVGTAVMTVSGQLSISI